MDGDYPTVDGVFETESVVKGSRFIGIVQRCPDADSVGRILDDISARYPNATHYCYAAVYGGRSRGERFSDNGEPSGTAGRPILSVLRGSGLSDTICVVVRYFGGTLLGTGGLVQAYTQSATDALSGCRRCTAVFCRTYRIDLPYDVYSSFLPKVSHMLVGGPECEYSDRVTVTMHVMDGQSEMFLRTVADATGGKLEPLDLGRTYRFRSS